MRHTATEASRYKISPVEGTQVVRIASGDPNQDHAFEIRCACGFRSGPYASAESAEDIRETHESECSWPTS